MQGRAAPLSSRVAHESLPALLEPLQALVVLLDPWGREIPSRHRPLRCSWHRAREAAAPGVAAPTPGEQRPPPQHPVLSRQWTFLSATGIHVGTVDAAFQYRYIPNAVATQNRLSCAQHSTDANGKHTHHKQVNECPPARRAGTSGGVRAASQHLKAGTTYIHVTAIMYTHPPPLYADCRTCRTGALPCAFWGAAPSHSRC